jgi:hypothetical protein
MRFSLRTLLIVLTIAPPLLAGLFYLITLNEQLWPWLFVTALMSVPNALMLLLLEMGSILCWVFRKQIEEDKARVARVRQQRDI